MNAIVHFLLHATGIDNTTGMVYAFWSGFGSDISEVALIGALFTMYKRRKCTKCWRLSHVAVQGTHYKTCHKHSTDSWHAALTQRHAERHPEQHAFLSNQENK